MALTFSNINTDNFYPFTLTRKIEDIRIGILTIRQKHELLKTVGETDPLQLPGIIDLATKQLNNVTDIVKLNDWSIRQDFALITKDSIPAQISSTNKLINTAQIFIEEGATVEHCLLNAAEGPIYIAKNALVMEGCMLRGPIAICENAVVKMGTKIYGGTTIGPYCTAGGEIKNTILSAYSNKAHDGYLGDSIIGEWCNLGAGTSNSNIKNTVGNIKIQLDKITIDAGTKFGLIMGDYSRAAINTSFNTGTVVGVCCNVFAEGLTPKFIPGFSWGSDDAVRYELPKAFTDIDNWKKLKGHTITEKEKEILTDIYKK
jgi:UDP-N-acetylglucosamine diphosphorylase/glucosamine-1-phosphate N-acetyltransferase